MKPSEYVMLVRSRLQHSHVPILPSAFVELNKQGVFDTHLAVFIHQSALQLPQRIIERYTAQPCFKYCLALAQSAQNNCVRFPDQLAVKGLGLAALEDL